MGRGAILQYRDLTRLREAAALPPDEAWVQRVWFERLCRQPLRTDDGRVLWVVQPGYWNHGGGPDFRQAVVRWEDGRVDAGAVEVHLRPEDWVRHGHDRDGAYEPVVLHVVWQAGLRKFTPATRAFRAVPQVELAGQLAVPVAALEGLFSATPGERRVGALAGRCRKALAGLPDAELAALLKEAGRHRFERRVRLWEARRAAWGEAQCLWAGLADALGYSGNREPFRTLAHRLPLGELRKRKDAETREALLYGHAGFLPVAPVAGGDDGQAWARRLWEIWWKKRAEHALPPVRGWQTRSLRPLNRPERRLAVLALLSEPARWKEWTAVCRTGDLRAMAELMEGLRHPYWTAHCSVGGAPLRRPAALLGPARTASFAFNCAWPLFAGGEGVREALEAARTGESMQPARIAQIRLLGDRPLGRAGRLLLVQEGLIQLYQDFCARDVDACAGCEFPEQIGKGLTAENAEDAEGGVFNHG